MSSFDRRPDWLKTRLPSGETYRTVDRLLGRLRLNTVCASARCPNLGECWDRGTATFMILGDVCTRHCRFCAVKTGNPKGATDPDEPERIAQAVAELGLKYVVLTSVDRDDLADLGAGAFARTILEVRRQRSKAKVQNGGKRSAVSGRRPAVEVLTPDFAAREDLLRIVLFPSRPTPHAPRPTPGPDVFAHNLETVEVLTPQVRDPRAGYRVSLAALAKAKELNPRQVTKSSIMVGLGETRQQVEQTLADLRAAQVDIVTIGQYLQPSRRNLAVKEYVTPERFAEYERIALGLGFPAVLAGPLVRSSYHAEEIRSTSTQVPRATPHAPNRDEPA